MKLSCRLLDHSHLLIIGGGSSGLGIASKMSRKLPKQSVSIVESNETHYYQPGFTLIGAGLMNIKQNSAPQETLTPNGVRLIKDRVKTFYPDQNRLILKSGKELKYNYMVISTGIEVRYDMIEGLSESLSDPNCPVSTIYLPQYAEKTYRLLSTIKSGEFVFTFPNTPIKCAGAPQKICYVADDILRSRGIRDSTNLHYYTTLPRIFGVEKYANELMKIVKDRGINLHTRHNLKKIDPSNRIAIFENLDKPGEMVEQNFSYLHVAPPYSTILPLRECPSLIDSSGFVDVNPKTLQSKRYPNVFGIGDCVNTSNAKTAAAISSQLKSVEKNLEDVMNGKNPSSEYDGYASCPLLVSRSKVILAEFGPNGTLETFPFDQSKPTRFAFFMKRYLMPFLYWNGLIKGYWNGPSSIRKILNPFNK